MSTPSALHLTAAPTLPADAEPAPRRRVRLVALTAFAALLALVVGLLSPAVAGASTPNATKAEWNAAVALENMLNAERSANHLPHLTMRTALLKSAHAHNLMMAQDNTMSHQLPGEAALGTRETRSGYTWHYAGENIGWNSAMTTAGVLALETIMFGERPPNDGHRLNILDRNYTNIGIDVYMDTAHHKVWLTEDFGRP